METIRYEDVKLLFHWDYYDIPLSGALKWNGKRYWFVMTDDDGRTVTYDLHDLSQEDWDRVDAEQALFERYVGRHTRYDEETQKRNLLDQEPHGNCSDNPYWSRPEEERKWKPTGTVVAKMVM